MCYGTHAPASRARIPDGPVNRHPQTSPIRDDRDKERVREASDIVRIVGESVGLRPKGREYVGLCPFHDDHTPSMYVVPSKQIFNCFVCGAAGDVFSFVMRMHKMEFPEALRFLAERAGITLQRKQPDGSPRSALLKACAFARDFFRTLLEHPEHGVAARGIIHRRGIAPEMVSQFQIGAAADRWDGLLLKLQSRQMSTDAFVEAGLLKRRESNDGVYDALRNRLIFPIHDSIGNVIAFGGRRINDDDEPKYINSPETRLFSKSETLYAFHHAARSIQAKRTAIVTEGYTDVIACHQAGVTNVVATLGTALTRGHARLLRRHCDRVVLLFDGDDAGRRAADRAVEVFFAEPIDVDIVTLSKFTDAKDPDELLKRENGREVFERAIASATGLLEYRFARLREQLAGAGIAALSKAVEEEVAWLGDQGLSGVAPVRQRLIIRKLADLAGVDESAIQRVLPAGRGRRPEMAREAVPDGSEELPRIRSTPMTTSDHLLGCILCDGTLLGAVRPEDRALVEPGVYGFELIRRVAGLVLDLASRGLTPDLSGVLNAVDDVQVQEAAISIASRVDALTERDASRLRRHWESCLVRARLDRANVEIKSGSQDALEAVRRRQQLHSTLGADRRVLPRPR